MDYSCILSSECVFIIIHLLWNLRFDQSLLFHAHEGAWPSHRTRENGFKLKEGRFRSDIWKKFFTTPVMKHRHRSPKEMVDAPPLETLRFHWTGLSATLSSWRCSCPWWRWGMEWTRWPLRALPTQLILWSQWFIAFQRVPATWNYEIMHMA